MGCVQNEDDNIIHVITNTTLSVLKAGSNIESEHGMAMTTHVQSICMQPWGSSENQYCGV